MDILFPYIGLFLRSSVCSRTLNIMNTLQCCFQEYFPSLESIAKMNEDIYKSWKQEIFFLPFWADLSKSLRWGIFIASKCIFLDCGCFLPFSWRDLLKGVILSPLLPLYLYCLWPLSDPPLNWHGALTQQKASRLFLLGYCFDSLGNCLAMRQRR